MVLFGSCQSSPGRSSGHAKAAADKTSATLLANCGAKKQHRCGVISLASLSCGVKQTELPHARLVCDSLWRDDGKNQTGPQHFFDLNSRGVPYWPYILSNYAGQQHHLSIKKAPRAFN